MRMLAKIAACGFILGALGLVLGGAAGAQDKKKEKKKVEFKVKVGDAAPDFTSTDENGKTFKSSDVVGKKIVVLYFYPADFTSGCTAQACAFRDDIEKLGSKGVMVVGVSGDSVKTHLMFKEHHKLPFTLLADEKGAVAKLFIASVNPGGKSPTIDSTGVKGTADRGVTIPRFTIVVDKAGKIADAAEIGNAGGDAKRVAELVMKLDTK